MAYKRLTYALSVSALALGAGIFTPTALAEGECAASNLEELEVCLASADATSVTTSNTIVISGEGVDKTLIINKDIHGANSRDVFLIENGAKLTLRGSGAIYAGRYGAIADGAELIIDGVNIDASNTACYGVFAKNNGRVTMESGQVVADYAAFAGNNTTGDMNFYVNGGQLRSLRYPAIYMPGQVYLEVRGGTIDGGIVARMGQIQIEGGTINKQSNPVAGDGLDVNYGGMPSMADEAITLVAGSYKSTTTDFGNSMNVVISGNQTKINGDVVLYDLGNTAAGYEQDVNLRIEDGRLSGFKTKFTQDEIGFSLKSGYTAGLNNQEGRIKVELTGGSYTAEPNPDDIIPDSEAEYDEYTESYVIYPKRVDYQNGFIESNGDIDGQAYVFVEFGDKELIADRKATLSATVVETEGLSLTGEGELIGAVDIDMLDRDGQIIEVKDNSLVIYFDIDEDTYNELKSYDELYAVYFNENGEEVERYRITLENEDDRWFYFWFETSHLSTYGVVGVNNGNVAEGGSESTSASAPNTGASTMAGTSASNAAIVTVAVAGVMTVIISLFYLRKKAPFKK